MRKKLTGIAGAIAVVSLVSSVLCTPVFAGITKEKMEEDDVVRINDSLSGVTIGNFDDAFATLSTVATKTGTYDGDRNYYAVTSNFPLKYRMYFNEYIDGNSGDKHALIWGSLVYKISPSGGETTDDTKWPFPQLKEAADNENRTVLQEFISTNITDIYHNPDTQPAVRSAGNMPTATADAKKGILTWRDGIDFVNHNVYGQYQNDSGRSYYTSQLEINNIVGSPGDKLEVKIYHFTNSQGNVQLSYNFLPTWIYGSSIAANPGDDTLQGGVHIESGYIYIPYELTYDANLGSNGTGVAPVANELYTCDHNSVTLPTQGSMSNGDSRLLGWSETKVNGTIDASEAPSDLRAPGSTFAINKDMKLYAVWGTPASEATPSLSKRVLQSGSTLIPDMSFTFKFEQLNEWNGVNYVSTAAPIGNQTVTVNSSSPRLTTDPFVGDLTGKTLYEGKIDNVLNGYSPTAAGTYAYKVSEVIPDPKAEGVSYTNSEFIMLVEVEDTPSGLKPVTVTNILYKDSQGNTKDQYTAPPAVFDEKHELIFYNNYGTDGGTTPTGIITNNLPFIVIIAGGVGGAVAATVIKAKKRAKR